MIVFLAVSIIVCLIIAGLFGYWAIALEELNIFGRILCAVLTLFATITAIRIANYGHHMRDEPIVIKTDEKPQIDTIITTINGMSDTTYVYHIRKK